ncbi:hypothetical protein BDV12DRAFT_176826 [Aspergillus spectabilis]
MPQHRPVPSLSLKTCSPFAPDPDDDGLAGSDDELDESQRSAQRRRIEKLGEAYLQGTSLFILSASLRGPFDKGWVNPWKKNRKQVTEITHGSGHTERPVIPETDSRKRRYYQSPSVASRSRLFATPRVSPLTDRAREDALRVEPTNRVPRSENAAFSTQSPRFTHNKPTDARWLKKDKVSTPFQHVDPPTSPTTSISSRHLKRGTASSQSTGRHHTSSESVRSPESHRFKQSKQSEASPRRQPEPTILALDKRRHTPRSKQQKDSSQSIGVGSVQVVSSSSQLPKFEYRRKQHGTSIARKEEQIHREIGEDISCETGASGMDDIPSNRPEDAFEEPPLTTQGAEPRQAELPDPQVTDNSLTLTNASNTIENPSATNLDKELTSKLKSVPTSENNLPSAQPAPGNPLPPDNLTSLYSIAISKATSNRTDDQNVDQQFSTQAALMMAQRSFQNDLRSPECSPVMSVKKRRASQDSHYQSSNAVNITPFHKMNTPDRDIAGWSSAPRTGAAQMISTQYMIDAATPFTFSTEKETEAPVLSSAKDGLKTKKRKTTSSALSSPSEIPSDHSTTGEHSTERITVHDLAHIRNSPSGSPQSAFPMTMTGTTPPTAQEGQGEESFNLSQAIADAGSWLQQSFDINKEITLCKSTKVPQSHPADTSH